MAETELNYIAPSTFVNDSSFNKLWGLHNTGQTGGKVDADIDAVEAWQQQTGKKSVVVAVIDSGGDYRHQDLAANNWRNTGEIAGNGIDDDGNGFVDDVYGYDFHNNDGDPMDDNGHGTHVAGTIGAKGNNNLGIVGVNHDVSLMHLKFLNNNGSGSTYNAVRAVEYAIKMGADVINASFGGGGYSSAFYDVIQKAQNAGITFVAAAGNNNNNNDDKPYYPTNYNVGNVISVAATDHQDNLAYFSNYGDKTVDLGAPGVGILSTLPGNKYASYNGTSMAAPHVAGAAALLLAEDSSLTPTQIKDILMKTVDPLTSLQGKTVTGGRLNLNNALKAVNQTPQKATINVTSPDWYAQETRSGQSENSGYFEITRSGGNTNQSQTVYYSVSGNATNGSDYAHLWNSVVIPAGKTSVKVPIHVIDDSVYEGTEFVSLTLQSSSAYDLGSSKSSSVYIYDNDPQSESTISLITSDSYASERKWSESQNSGLFRVYRSGGDNSKSETIRYTVSGTAGNGSDYNYLPGYITIPAGSSYANLPITVRDDSTYEGLENVQLTLSAGSNYKLSSSKSGTVWIYDNDSPSKSTINIQSYDTYASENGNSGYVKVSRSGGNNSQSERVYYSITGSSSNGNDYSYLNSYIDIPAGSTTAYIPINPINDSIYEGTESVSINLQSSSAYNTGSSTNGTVYIYDNDPKPKSTINLYSNDTSGWERNAGETPNDGQFYVYRSGGDNSKAETVYYSVSGSATNGSDYSYLSGYVTIPAGSSFAYIPVDITNDSSYEGTEQVQLTLNSNSNYLVGSNTTRTVTIYDNDPKPKSTINLYSNDTSGWERNAGETPNDGQFYVYRSGGDNSKAETVYYSVSGSATNGSDYSYLSGYVTIPAGSSFAYIPVDITNDSSYEGTEQVQLTLNSNSNYLVGSNTTRTVTIYDNDFKSTISINGYDNYATEDGNSGYVQVSRSGGNNSQSERVYYSISGSASNGNDYSYLNSYIDIPAGSTTAYIAINPINDSIYEGTETVSINLQSSSAYNTGSSTNGMVYIYDNDFKSTINISSYDTYANENDGLGDRGSVKVSRSGGDNSRSETVYYSVSGTATNGSDYNRLSGSVTIPAGATTTYIPIIAIDDSTYEGTEQLQLTLQSSSAYNTGSSTSGMVYIYDNDPQPKSTISISNYDRYAMEGVHQGSIQVTRSGGNNSQSERVYYSISGSAGNGSDYTYLPGYIDIPAGSTTTYITVRPNNDSNYEGTEEVRVNLQSSSNYNTGSSTSGYVYIYDDDPEPKSTINISNHDTNADENGNDGYVKVTRSGGNNSQSERVYYSISGSAINGSDYSYINSYIDIPAGLTTAYIPVRPINDSTYEGTEYMWVTLQSSSTYNTGSSTSGYVNIYDNDVAGNPDIDIQLDYYSSFSSTVKNAMEQAARNWEAIITKDKVASGVLQIAVTQGYQTMQGESWGHWGEATWTTYPYQQNARYDLTTSDSFAGNYAGQSRMHFNSNVVNTLSQNYLIRLAMHEIGHTLGLDEAQNDYSLGMDAIMDSTGIDPKISEGIYNRLEWMGYEVNRNASISWS
ncbi:S8 family serine peptidase [Laspinema sp. D3]|nr:S8 family serine peptidase [Laspinema sp. D2c]